MQKIFGIAITKHSLIYSIIKLLLIAVIPLTLLVFHYDIFFILYTLTILAILILSIITLPFTKKSLWQLCSGAQIKFQKDASKKKSYIIIPLLLTVALIFIPFFSSNFGIHIHNFIQNSKNAVFPISILEKSYYVKNIEQYREEPVNYVMQLFDKYDIVILCESLHPECTQWEFFSKIIMNDVFADNVKNVFIEIGDINNQKKLDSYMNTHFSTEDDLQRATAAVARESTVWPLWNNTNIYDFILNLHKFNETGNSTGRINLYYSDSTTDWNKIKNSTEYDSILHHSKRDSIMAYNIINKYKNQHLNKCLIITNTRHAWNFGENEVTYIFKNFPDKVAVVLINGMAQLLYPAMNGTLDAAALEIQNNVWAIDLRNCPLGNIQFDLWPIFRKSNPVYMDLFVGIVYCGHPSNWILGNNYPYILDNYQDTLLKRSALLGKEYLDMQKINIESGYYDTVHKRKSPLFALTNLVFLIIHGIILLFLFFNLLIQILLNKNKDN
jgi:hypothetical protein